MDRDFTGYTNQLPKITWPNGSKLAISFVLNYEEGAERNILDGDAQAEDLFVDIPGIKTRPGKRHLSCESMFEYGSRVGVWRLTQLFDHYQIPITFFACGLALERNPPLCEYLKTAKHEIAGHGYRWIDYFDMPLEQEREHIAKTIKIIKEKTGKEVDGWYTGRISENTRALLTEFNIKYDCQSYADDLPYWFTCNSKPLLIIPYTLDINDIRYCTAPGWGSPAQAFETMKYAFDCLYAESVDTPKILTIGLHARISGRPARAQALKQFIDYTKDKSVYFCRRKDIAEIWSNYGKR